MTESPRSVPYQNRAGAGRPASWVAGGVCKQPGGSQGRDTGSRGAGGPVCASQGDFSSKCLPKEDKSKIKISSIFPLICSFLVLARLIRHMLPISCSS